VASRRETDLYEPIKQYLTALGFAVRGEVDDCDLVAVRGDEAVVVEMKIRFGLQLVLQGIERQQLADSVYLAVEAPASRRSSRRWRQIKELCRRLGMGLITVRFGTGRPLVEVLLDPAEPQRRTSAKKRAHLLREFAQRSGDYNTGGTTRRPLVTAYREAALEVAAYLRRGPASVADVRAATGRERAGDILADNYYGWFQRVSRGVYCLTSAGSEALERYADVLAKT